VRTPTREDLGPASIRHGVDAASIARPIRRSIVDGDPATDRCGATPVDVPSKHQHADAPLAEDRPNGAPPNGDRAVAAVLLLPVAGRLGTRGRRRRSGGLERLRRSLLRIQRRSGHLAGRGRDWRWRESGAMRFQLLRSGRGDPAQVGVARRSRPRGRPGGDVSIARGSPALDRGIRPDDVGPGSTLGVARAGEGPSPGLVRASALPSRAIGLRCPGRSAPALPRTWSDPCLPVDPPRSEG